MIRTASFVTLLMATASAAHAGGSALAQQSATAGGTAGAGTARANDASAAWFNPAALADGGGLRFGLGLTLAFPKVDARAMDGSWQTSTDSGVKTPPHVYASWAEGRWMASLSVGVPFGGGATWPDTWEGRHEIVSTNLQVFRIAPAFGYRFGRVRIAAGPQLDLATLEITRGLDFVDTEGTVQLALSGQALGAHASVFVEATDALDVGLTYKSRTRVGFSGDADFTAPDEFAVKTTDQQAETEMTMPDRFVLGGRYRHGALAVLADIDMTLWSVNEELVIDFERDETPNAVTTNGWGTTLGLRGGVEYGLRSWIVRGGAFYDPSPAPVDNLRPTSPDSNRVGASVGLSRRLANGVSIDAFYEYMRLLGRRTENMDTIQAEYSGHAQFLGVGIRLQPGN